MSKSLSRNWQTCQLIQTCCRQTQPALRPTPFLQARHHHKLSPSISVDPPPRLSQPLRRLRTHHANSRSFSTSSPRHVAGASGAIAPNRRGRMRPSMAVHKQRMQAEALRKGAIPDDMGLLPGTFIMPPAVRRPPWRSAYKARMELERARLSVLWTQLREYLTFRYAAVRPRPKTLSPFGIARVAQDLHKEMYTALAAGDLRPVEGQLCEGLRASLRKRLADRRPDERLRWKLHAHVTPPALVSLRATLMPTAGGKIPPAADAHGLVQAVVRLHTRQSVLHVRPVVERDARGKKVREEGVFDVLGRQVKESEVEEWERKEARECVEYVVVQRSLRNSKLGDWMVWGSAEETTSERLRETRRRLKEEERKFITAKSAPEDGNKGAGSTAQPA